MSGKTRLLLAGCVLAALVLFFSPYVLKGWAYGEGPAAEQQSFAREAGWPATLRWGQDQGRALPEVLVGGRVILRVRSAAGGLAPWERGQIILERLRAAGRKGVDPKTIVPGFMGGEAVVRAGDMLLATADRETARANSLSPMLLAYTWANNLRLSLGVPALDREEAYRALSRGRSLAARASWYGPGFHGRPTASGEIFDQNVLTAAHRSLPFGTLVLVRNPANGKSVLVRINDRGPYVPGRSIDLSRAAARAIGMEETGVADVELIIVGR